MRLIKCNLLFLMQFWYRLLANNSFKVKHFRAHHYARSFYYGRTATAMAAATKKIESKSEFNIKLTKLNYCTRTSYSPHRCFSYSPLLKLLLLLLLDRTDCTSDLSNNICSKVSAILKIESTFFPRLFFKIHFEVQNAFNALHCVALHGIANTEKGNQNWYSSIQ